MRVRTNADERGRFLLLAASCASIAVGLLLVPAALGRTAVVSASAEVTGPAGDGYVTLTVRNTGDEAIHCIQYAVPTSVGVVSARRPSSDWRVFASTGSPAPDIGILHLGTTGLRPGEVVRLEFRTEPAFPTRGLGTLAVSSSKSCTPRVVSTVPGPPPPACKCTKMDVKVDPTLLQKRRLPRAKQRFGIGFTWTMTCDAGEGGCQGKVEFLPPRIIAGSLPKPRGNLRLNIRRATITCLGQCAATTQRRFEIKMRSNRQLNQLFGRTLAFRVRLFCTVDGQPVPAGGELIRVLVDQQGRMRAR